MANFPNRCQHIKVNGTQCGCPALRHNKLCYFHKRNHEERIELDLDRLKNARARRRKVVMELPVLEEANRLTKEGARQREAERVAELKQDAEDRAAAAALENTIPARTASHQGKRPPANVSMDEVRKSVTAQIRKALPAIAAAVRENGDSRG
ncbi:MAG: hypothetical protein WAM69_18945 [Candidatus Sulfotelmatobacter sp.]